MPTLSFFLSCSCCISINFSFPKGSIHPNLPHAFVLGIKNKIHFFKKQSIDYIYLKMYNLAPIKLSK